MCSVAGALATPAVNAPLTVPTASVLGAPPLVAPLLQPTLPAVLGLPGSALPVVSAAPQPAETVGAPSECLLLKNMFDPSVEVGLAAPTIALTFAIVCVIIFRNHDADMVYYFAD